MLSSRKPPSEYLQNFRQLSPILLFFTRSTIVLQVLSVRPNYNVYLAASLLLSTFLSLAPPTHPHPHIPSTSAIIWIYWECKKPISSSAQPNCDNRIPLVLKLNPGQAKRSPMGKCETAIQVKWPISLFLFPLSFSTWWSTLQNWSTTAVRHYHCSTAGWDLKLSIYLILILNPKGYMVYWVVPVRPIWNLSQALPVYEGNHKGSPRMLISGVLSKRWSWWGQEEMCNPLLIRLNGDLSPTLNGDLSPTWRQAGATQLIQHSIVYTLLVH